MLTAQIWVQCLKLLTGAVTTTSHYSSLLLFPAPRYLAAVMLPSLHFSLLLCLQARIIKFHLTPWTLLKAYTRWSLVLQQQAVSQLVSVLHLCCCTRLLGFLVELIATPPELGLGFRHRLHTWLPSAIFFYEVHVTLTSWRVSFWDPVLNAWGGAEAFV